MQQMHDKVVLHPIKCEQLTRSQKHGAVQVLMFLKQKQCGKIKCHAVADEQKQRAGSKKSNITSPTAATELVLITAAIDAAEGWDVSMIDAPGSFLTADMDEEVIVILDNNMVDAVLEIDRKIYGKYVIYGGNEKKHMYVRLSKAMYGTLEAALLYDRKLSKELRKYGFVINPYDPCVANKWTSEGQLTVVWHVDDMKASHKNKEEVKKLLSIERKLQ